MPIKPNDTKFAVILKHRIYLVFFSVVALICLPTVYEQADKASILFLNRDLKMMQVVAEPLLSKGL